MPKTFLNLSRKSWELNKMADGYLENHYAEYEKRKADWLRKKKHLPKTNKKLERPDDESL